MENNIVMCSEVKNKIEFGQFKFMAKDIYIYDRSIGQCWKCCKKPTTEQYLEINRRKDNGEGLGTILSDMRLL